MLRITVCFLVVRELEDDERSHHLQVHKHMTARAVPLFTYFILYFGGENLYLRACSRQWIPTDFF